MNEPPDGRPVQSFSGLAHSREFLEAVAAVGRAQASKQLGQEESRSRRPVLLGFTAVVTLLLLLAREQGWGLGVKQDTVPRVFYGSWATTAERYADRGFTITGDSLRLLTGRGRGVTYPIVGVRREKSDSTRFTFHYRDGDLSMTLRLHLEPDTIIHLASLPRVAWTRKSR